MRNRVKEDEKIERSIRGLLKLPANRRCINCNSLGPQYVCTTFSTFVCTNCSGVHREFTHRVKSVSVAKFTAEEVNALQVGGNERARQIYFKAWDPQRHGFPESSNMHRLRDFVKHVYVDRKYSGEKGTELPRLRLSETEESKESKRVDVYHGGSSPYAGDKYSQSFSARSSPCGKRDDKHFTGYYDESRSPRFSRENLRHGGYKRSPVCFEIVDNRVRDDRFASRRFAQGEFKIKSLEPDSRVNSDRSSSPVVRSIREILGENVPALQIGGVSKYNDRKDADGPDHNQESANGNPLEHEIINSQSLIDFSTETEIPDAAASSQTQQVSSSNNSSIWPSFDPPTKEKSSQAPNANTLESLLFGLSVPSTPPASDMSAPGSTDVPSTSFQDSMLAVSPTLPAPGQQQPKLLDVASVPEQFSFGDLPQAATTGVKNVARVTAEQPYAYPVATGGPISEQTIPSIGASNKESRPSSVAHYAQESLCISAEQSSQSVSSPVHDTSYRVESQPLPLETNSSTRKELPAGLFTASYSSMATPVPGWGSGPPGQMGFNMHYSPNTMPVSAFPVPAKSTNPFDINDERIQFPSMASLQGALPNVSAPTTIVQASSLGTYPSPLNAPQSTAPQSTATASVMPPRSPSFESALSSAGFMGQGVQSSMLPSRSQEMVGFGSGLQPTSRYSAPTTPNSSMGGNPFG
ncbi:hypothetical protein UlMin_035434 [Ulmus minor]